MNGIFGKLLCSHPETAGEPDENGQAICTACGELVTVTLTPALFRRTCELVRRDFGMAGRHSMRCVETPDGWCCADDCTIGARTA